MGGRTTITAPVKGVEDEEAWFQKEHERSRVKVYEAISIPVSQTTQQQQQELFTMFERKSSEAGVVDIGGEVEEDDDDATGRAFCCFPSSRERRYSRPEAVACDDGTEPGSSFSRLEDSADSKGVLRPLRSLWASCCGSTRRSRTLIVEVRDVGVHKEELGARDHRLRSAGRWEVDVSDEYFKPPMWKQLVRKMKARARHVQGSRNEVWLNYDAQSYEKNFDNGEFRQQYNVHSLNEDDQLAAKDTALHAALLQRFASARSQQIASNPVTLPAAA